MNLDNAVKTLEATYGTFTYSKREKEDDFTTYTARINVGFWDEIKNVCIKNKMKLGDFIRNAFILYYFQLNGELSEDESKKYINPAITDAGTKLDDVTSVIENVQTSLSDKIDNVQADVKTLNAQFNMLVTLFGGKLAATAVQ